MKKIVFSIIIFLSLPSVFYPQNFWQQTNGPFGGAHINDFLYYKDSIIFLATEEGLIKSVDNGENWNRISPETTKIRSLAKDSSGYLYAGENYSSDNFFILKSTDEGNTWSRMNLNIWPDVRQFFIPYQDTIYLCTWGDGIYKSTDRGASWELKNNGITHLNIRVMCLLSNGDLLIGTYEGGVYRSIDGANFWTQSNTGIPPYGTNIDARDFCEFAPGNILVGSQDGIYYSSNYGNTWVPRNNGYSGARANKIIKGKNGIIYAGSYVSRGVYYTSDNGNNWAHLGLGNAIYTLDFDINQQLCIGTSSDGLYRLNFGDTSWTQIYNRGYAHVEVNKLALTNNATIIAATDLWGIQRSNNEGQTWNRANYAGGEVYAIESINDSCIIVGSGDIYVSNDTGQNWEVKSTFLGLSISFDSSNQSIYIGSIPSLIRSTDYGNVWNEIVSFGDPCNIYATHVTRLNKNILIEVIYPSYPYATSVFFISTDQGVTWESKLENKFITQIEEDNLGNIYALGNALYLSQDEGNTWIQKDIGGRGIITLDSHGRIFSASPNVFYSNDQATTWFQVSSTGLIGSGGINDIKIDRFNRIFLATPKGVYAGDANNIVSVYNEISVVSKYTLSQNYPNPFNPSTSIQYAISSTQFVTLKVYDLLGREVATLVNEEKTAGSYNVEFRMQNLELSSGIYFYKLQAGDFVETKKMILLK